jgi:hypothetical protein
VGLPVGNIEGDRNVLTNMRRGHCKATETHEKRHSRIELISMVIEHFEGGAPQKSWPIVGQTVLPRLMTKRDQVGFSPFHG